MAKPDGLQSGITYIIITIMEQSINPIEIRIGESVQTGCTYIFLDGVRLNIKFASGHQAEKYLKDHLNMYLNGAYACSN